MIVRWHWPFSLSFFHKYMGEFSRDCLTYHNRWNAEVIWESSCLLLIQNLKTFIKICTMPISSQDIFVLENVGFFLNKKLLFMLTCKMFIIMSFRSDQISRSVVSDSLWPHESQHARPPYPSPTPGVHLDSRPSSQWGHPDILSSVVPFSSCPQSLLASESFPMSQLFTWGGQSTGVSALASFLPKKSQAWSPSEWTGWISLQSKGLSRVFSNTTVQKHQFFGAQPSSQSNSHIHTWPQEKP